MSLEFLNKLRATRLIEVLQNPNITTVGETHEERSRLIIRERIKLYIILFENTNAASHENL